MPPTLIAPRRHSIAPSHSTVGLARRRVARRQPTRPHSVWPPRLKRADSLTQALETFRELQLTFRQASAFDTADAGARRLSAQISGSEPLTEADYDAIVDRLVGVAAFRRAVDMQIEWLEKFPDSPQAVNIEAAMVQNLYLLRANGEARDRAAAFLKRHSGSSDAHQVIITLFRLDVREGRHGRCRKTRARHLHRAGGRHGVERPAIGRTSAG